MAKVKRVLDSLDDVSENLKEYYSKADDGKFHFDVEDPDVDALKRAKDHEVSLRKESQQKLGTLQATLTEHEDLIKTLQEQQGKDTNELRTTLEKDFEGRMSKFKETSDSTTKTLQEALRQSHIHDVAARMAKELVDPKFPSELLAKEIEGRLSMEIVDERPVTRVTSPEGTASSMSVDELKNEYFTNDRYAGIMLGSKASGGGAQGAGSGGGAPRKLADMTTDQRNKMAKENPDHFKKLVASAKEADKKARQDQQYL